VTNGVFAPWLDHHAFQRVVGWARALAIVTIVCSAGALCGWLWGLCDLGISGWKPCPACYRSRRQRRLGCHFPIGASSSGFSPYLSLLWVNMLSGFLDKRQWHLSVTPFLEAFLLEVQLPTNEFISLCFLLPGQYRYIWMRFLPPHAIVCFRRAITPGLSL
jgi:hypothetical protein